LAVIVPGQSAVVWSTSTTTDDANAGVTLLVTESEARVLAFAAANGDLTLAIAPPESALHSPS
jgi:Flp pilus assembly protein CpaB